jgi:hypothetical protein
LRHRWLVASALLVTVFKEPSRRLGIVGEYNLAVALLSAVEG